jgi:predicted nucleic acid-binding protein
MIAVDTNILIYSLDRSEPLKRSKARELLRRLKSAADTGLPWQVAGEFVRYLRACEDQRQLTRAHTLRYVTLFRRYFPLILPTAVVLDKALELSARFSLSHWDSMLVAACLEAGVDTLYTEDMGAPVKYDSLGLINPFV